MIVNTVDSIANPHILSHGSHVTGISQDLPIGGLSVYDSCEQTVALANRMGYQNRQYTSFLLLKFDYTIESVPCSMIIPYTL